MKFDLTQIGNIVLDKLGAQCGYLHVQLSYSRGINPNCMINHVVGFLWSSLLSSPSITMEAQLVHRGSSSTLRTHMVLGF